MAIGCVLADVLSPESPYAGRVTRPCLRYWRSSGLEVTFSPSKRQVSTTCKLGGILVAADMWPMVVFLADVPRVEAITLADILDATVPPMIVS